MRIGAKSKRTVGKGYFGEGRRRDERAFEMNMGVNERRQDVAVFSATGGLYMGDTFALQGEDRTVDPAVNNVNEIRADVHFAIALAEVVQAGQYLRHQA
jgi:hypothetical protein